MSDTWLSNMPRVGTFDDLWRRDIISPMRGIAPWVGDLGSYAPNLGSFDYLNKPASSPSVKSDGTVEATSPYQDFKSVLGNIIPGINPGSSFTDDISGKTDTGKSGLEWLANEFGRVVIVLLGLVFVALGLFALVAGQSVTNVVLDGARATVRQ